MTIFLAVVIWTEFSEIVVLALVWWAQLKDISIRNQQDITETDPA